MMYLLEMVMFIEIPLLGQFTRGYPPVSME